MYDELFSLVYSKKEIQQTHNLNLFRKITMNLDVKSMHINIKYTMKNK